MTDLTNRERSAYVFILEYIDRHGYAPTVREVCRGMGLKSSSGGKYYLDQLADKGMINRDYKVSRGISLKGAK